MGTATLGGPSSPGLRFQGRVLFISVQDERAWLRKVFRTGYGCPGLPMVPSPTKPVGRRTYPESKTHFRGPPYQTQGLAGRRERAQGTPSAPRRTCRCLPLSRRGGHGRETLSRDAGRPAPCGAWAAGPVTAGLTGSAVAPGRRHRTAPCCRTLCPARFQHGVPLLGPGTWASGRDGFASWPLS